MTKEFDAKLLKLRRLFAQELVDGCNDCVSVKAGGFCAKHESVIHEMMNDTRKYIDVRTGRFYFNGDRPQEQSDD